MLSCTPAFFKLNSWLLWSFMDWTGLGSPFSRIMTLKTPLRRLQNSSNRSRSLSWSGLQSPSLSPFEYGWQHLKWQPSVYGPLLLVWMNFGGKCWWNGIEHQVRSVECGWQQAQKDRGNDKGQRGPKPGASKKTDWSSLPDCTIYIKWLTGIEVLSFGTIED